MVIAELKTLKNMFKFCKTWNHKVRLSTYIYWLILATYLLTIKSDVIYECSLSKSCQETLSRIFTIESLSEIPVLEEFFCNPLDINFEYYAGDFEKIAKRKEFRHGRTMWLWPRTEILKPIMKSKGQRIEGDDYSSNFRGYKWVTEAK